jgi:hypothetical protein
MNAITASYTITGSQPAAYYSASWTGYNPYVTEPLPEAKDKGVQEFFEKLGYSVTCDSSRRTGESWFEIHDDGLVCQIDQGVPLTDIVKDICQWHLGKDGVSESDWKCCGPDTPELRLLFKRVYDWHYNKWTKHLHVL